MDVNNVIVSGRLTSPAVVSTLKNGTLMAKFSIANNRKYGADHVSFFNCVAWGGTAKIIQDYTSKGQLITVCGEMKQDRWEKDGKTLSNISVIVREIILAPKAQGSSSTTKSMLDGEDVSNDTDKQFEKQMEINDDDIPF